ncbi:hypothetical protein V1293_007249 [Bradyrhizobium sp. AZCC 1693]
MGTLMHTSGVGELNRKAYITLRNLWRMLVVRRQTSSEKYSWMNHICSIASGSLSANARTLDVFQVL